MTTTTFLYAPGKPGIVPRWTSSGKIGVGTAISGDCNVWYTISHGIINEVYFPRVDIANIRDLGLIVTDGKEFFSEEKRHAVHDYTTLYEGVPAGHIINTCEQGRYKIEKKIIADPRRNVILQETIFTPLIGKLEDYHLYVLLAPHILNAGLGNNGWTGEYKRTPMLFAQKDWITLACASSSPFINMSCGYVGTSDAWLDIKENKRMTQFYKRAVDGNIALAAEIDLKASGGKFILALGFGNVPDAAALQTRAALQRDFDWALEEFKEGWQDVQKLYMDLSQVDKAGASLFRTSTTVLKTHEGKHFMGSVISSLSIPWGASKGDNDLGGYHLIWPRDQVQTAMALLAAGDFESARQALLFLMCTQEADGHWFQCLWADGSPYWQGLQMDETALPVLLADNLRRKNFINGMSPWKMVFKAASFLIKNGPITQEDRWEENGGFTPYTIATEIAALLAAADFFDDKDLKAEAQYLREVADYWNESIERWIYVENSKLDQKYGVKGHYVRIRPADSFVSDAYEDQLIMIKNQPAGQNVYHFADIVSPDALAMVRYGLRSANDPRILDTIKIIDAMLKTVTVKGTVWHRYNEDGYGEHQDGAPFDGTGMGRGWPLLTGERAHYELAKGNKQGAFELLRDMERLAGMGGMIPEQIWDSADIPERALYNGHSTGSAKPLVWAHAEYIMLLRSLQDGKVHDMPPQTVERYLKNITKCVYVIWRFIDKIKTMPQGKKLRIQINAKANVRWSQDGWKTYSDIESVFNDLGVYFVNLPVDKLPSGSKISFTFFWIDSQKWEDANHDITVE